MSNKSFTTALTQDHQEKSSKRVLGSPIEVDVDERAVRFSGASSGQMMALIAMDGQSEMQRMATIINFFFSVVEKDSDRSWLKSRLFNPDDPFDEDMMSDITLYLIEQWTGRPTPPSSGSGYTPDTTGMSSTPSGQNDMMPTPPPYISDQTGY